MTIDLDYLQRLCDDATEGPWFVHDFTELFGDSPKEVTVSCDHPATLGVCFMDRGLTAEIEESRKNAQLIAAARTAIPALIAEVHRLREKAGEA